jgi:putative proteasome-type protease
MTYCVGMMLDAGLVLMSDTRTNSGVDNISTFRKMHSWSVPGERMVALMTSGNLATTQAVVAKLEERNKARGRNTCCNAHHVRHGRAYRQAARNHRRARRGQWPEASGQFGATLICRADQGHGDAPLPDLSRGQFHRGQLRHALLPDRRDQIRPPIILRGYTAR